METGGEPGYALECAGASEDDNNKQMKKELLS
jgi:hypothetical protein